MNRIQIVALSLSAASLIGIAAHEGYREYAYTPVPGDRLTLGFGDAQGVKPGQRTDPVRALVRLGDQVSMFERELKACVGDVPMYQHEWDAMISWVFNVGSKAACNSTLVKKLKQNPPDYVGACNELLRWNKFQGRELKGLTLRRQEEHKKCLGL
jgi:lysozyme